MSIDDTKKVKSPFTGRCLHPIVRRENGFARVDYVYGECHSPDEDWSLQIDAYEKTDKSFNIWIYGKLIMNVPNELAAREKMSEYIDENGNFKDNSSGLEEKVQN